MKLIENIPIEDKSLLPESSFFIPDEIKEEKKEEILKEISEKQTAMLVDGDADGIGAVAVVKEALEDVGFLATSPNNLKEDLERFKQVNSSKIFIVDLCPDSLQKIEPIKDIAKKADIYWYDHHKWDEEILEAVEKMGVEIVIGDSEKVCSADVVLNELESKGHTVSEQTKELIKLTRDHDLWIKNDPRSDNLSDLSHYLSSEEYLEAIQGGINIDEYKDFLEEKRREKRKLIELAVKRSSIKEIKGIKIAQTYGRCSQNEVAEKLREQSDVVTVAKPEGGISIRGSESFKKCHEVASLLGGGGHPKAAGCKPPIFNSMLDYAKHWVSKGEKANKEVLEAFKKVVN